MRHNVTWSHVVVPNVHLLVPKIAFEELLEEKYAHFGQFEDKISQTQTHPVFSEQVNATRVVAFTMRSYIRDKPGAALSFVRTGVLLRLGA